MMCSTGNPDGIEQHIKLVLENSRMLEDRLRAYETQIYALGANQHSQEAIDLAFQVLRELGEPQPRKAHLLHVVANFFWTKHLLENKTEPEILTLPRLRNYQKVAAMRIMQLVFAAVQRTRPQFAPSLAATQIIGLMMFGVILCHPFGYITEGIQVSQTAMTIVDEFKAEELRCRGMICLYGFARSWKDPLQ
jgi:predicted ATPase